MNRKILTLALTTIASLTVAGGMADAGRPQPTVSVDPVQVPVDSSFAVTVGSVPCNFEWEEPEEEVIGVFLVGPDPATEVRLGAFSAAEVPGTTATKSFTLPPNTAIGTYTLELRDFLCEVGGEASTGMAVIEQPTPTTEAPTPTTEAPTPTPTVTAAPAPPTKLPSTGGETGVMAWLALVVLSGGFGLTLVARRS